MVFVFMALGIVGSFLDFEHVFLLIFMQNLIGEVEPKLGLALLGLQLGIRSFIVAGKVCEKRALWERSGGRSPVWVGRMIHLCNVS
jgi:hypothetical protein